MGKRKSLAKREPNGKPKRAAKQQQLPSATEVQRLRTAALAGMRDAAWGTTLGWLHLNGKLTASEMAAGLRYAELVAEYSRVVGSPRRVRSVQIDGLRTFAGINTPTARRQMLYDQQTVDEFMKTVRLIYYPPVARAIGSVCEENLMPAGQEELEWLRMGLRKLVDFWGGKG